MDNLFMKFVLIIWNSDLASRSEFSKLSEKYQLRSLAPIINRDFLFLIFQILFIYVKAVSPFKKVNDFESFPE